MDSTSTPSIGIRVGIFHSCTEQTLLLFGYGVYEADEVPPEGILGQAGPMHLVGLPTPKLRLDDGTIIWGCEAWWAPEAEVKALFEAGRNIVRPKLASLREKRMAEWDKACRDLDAAEEGPAQIQIEDACHRHNLTERERKPLASAMG